MVRPTGLQSEHCIVCGRANAIGLRLAFACGPDGASADWQVDERYQGYDGVTHGGIVMAILDDAMWYAAYGQGALTLTAEATVRYHAPVLRGQTVTATGQARRIRGRLWECTAELRAAGGQRLASASGRFLEVPPDRAAALSAGLPPSPGRVPEGN